MYLDALNKIFFLLIWSHRSFADSSQKLCRWVIFNFLHCLSKGSNSLIFILLLILFLPICFFLPLTVLTHLNILLHRVALRVILFLSECALFQIGRTFRYFLPDVCKVSVAEALNQTYLDALNEIFFYESGPIEVLPMGHKAFVIFYIASVKGTNQIRLKSQAELSE